MSGRLIKIGKREVGPGEQVFIIAEAGVNHNGDLPTAKRLVDVACVAGADAVKFQTFKADRVVTAQAPKADYQMQTTSKDESQLRMLQELELSPQAHQELHSHCQERGIMFMSSPFDKGSVDLLEKMGVPAYKIGSGEITNWPFLEYVARKGKPVILSTGASELREVEEALRVMRRAGNEQLILLHCVSNYPADPADANLRAMQTMASAFQVPVGYSDHTPGIDVALASVALGACVIEKHFTLDKDMPGPDHKASLEPRELEALVQGIRIVEKALGDGIKIPRPSEENTRRIARRSLVLVRDIPEGNEIEPDKLTALRPGTGIAPSLILSVIGRKAARDLKRGTVLKWEDIK